MTNNLKLFFDDFDKLSEFPDGIQKLRELILQLAVQGILVPQDPNDEPASELLKKIKAEKEKLIKKGKLKKQKPLPPIDPDEIPYKLPKGWEWVRLGNIQIFTNGYAFKSEYYQETGVGIIRMGELGNDGNIDESSMKYVSQLIADSLPKMFWVYPGDMLMGMSGSIGKLAFNRTNKTYLLNQRVGCLEPILVQKDYLYSFLRTIEQLYLDISFGMAIQNLSTKQINNTPFPIPPLAEQKRIIAKVDELMALCDELETKQQKKVRSRVVLNDSALDHLLKAGTPKDFDNFWQLICENFDLLYNDLENVNKLRQAVLQLAVQGKLVPQDPLDEPASELLKKIKAEKEKLIKEGKIKKQKPLPPIEPGEIPCKLPKGWEWVRLGECGFTQTGTTPSKSKSEFFGHDYPFVKPADIFNDHINYDNEGLSALGIEKGRLIKNGSVLMVCIGGSIGKVGFVNRDCSCNQQINALTPCCEMSNKLFAYFLRCPYFQNEVLSRAPQTTLPILSKGKWDLLLLPLPPLPEQKRIVKKVDELMTLCDKLAERIKQSQAKSENLMAATIHHLLHRPLPEKQAIPDKKKSQTPYKDDAAVICLLLVEMERLTRPTTEFFIQKHMFITKHHLHLPVNSLFVRKVAGPWSHELKRKAIFAAVKMNWLRWEKNRLVAGSAFEKALNHAAMVLGESAAQITQLVDDLKRFGNDGLERWTTVLKVVEDLKGTQQPVTRTNIQREINTWPGKSLKQIFAEESVDYTIDKMLKHKWLAPLDKP